MAFEAEVIPLFIGGVSIVTVLELVVGWGLLKGQKRAFGCLAGHAVSMAAAMVFLIHCIFAGRLGMEIVPGIQSIDNSVNIAMFGVFWAVSVCFALAMVWAAGRKQK